MIGNGSLLFLLALSLATLGCSHGTTAPHAAAGGAHHSSYASEAYDPESGLSTAEIEELRIGAGMGLARPAELNSYPGPLHVIDMSDELALTDEQEARTSRLFDSMRATALDLGRQIIEQETMLARRFRHGHIDDATLEQLTSGIAKLRGELRRSSQSTSPDEGDPDAGADSKVRRAERLRKLRASDSRALAAIVDRGRAKPLNPRGPSQSTYGRCRRLKSRLKRPGVSTRHGGIVSGRTSLSKVPGVEKCARQ
ncbi:MAG: hypothetical protein KY459_03195 [Acidobacteria bacterium]|nr:hypothetical protein [Acidobacteriota bacterium]